MRNARWLCLACGVAEIIASFTPAVHIPIGGNITFAALPHGVGAVIVALGLLTVLGAIPQNGRWQWLPSALLLFVLATVYERVVTDPSRTFADPLLRRVIHPAWGFPTMVTIALVCIIAGIVAHSRARSIVEPVSGAP